MTGEVFETIRNYMRSMADAAAHDELHIYRVLHQALKIAANYEEIDRDVLLAACLLHDIGRKAQLEDSRICHAVEGGHLAYAFMKKLGWEEARCRHVRDCVTTHRFRSDNPPQTLEAKILFDADKLDVTGALGIARSLAYEGQLGEPLYRVNADFQIDRDFSKEAPPSFLKEYNFKLIKLYDRFYTPEAARIAQKRRAVLESYYNALLEEIDLSGLPEAVMNFLEITE